MIEVEQKFIVENIALLRQRLQAIGAVGGTAEQHADTYYNHPARDFAETGEALRVRRINGLPEITYKGPKLPGSIKARQELQWRLDPGDPEGRQTEELLELLGFYRVATVEKWRFPYALAAGAPAIMIDQVTSLGDFAEIELLVPSRTEVEPARQRVANLAAELGLRLPEPNSYLTLFLDRFRGSQSPPPQQG